MQAIRQALLLSAVSLVAATALWAVRPDRLPLRAEAEVYALDLTVPLMSLDEARGCYDAGSHYFVDTRAAEPGSLPAIPGSFTIRETVFADDLESVMDFLYPEDALILYGAGNPLPVDAVAARLLDQGYENLTILQGGLAAWQAAGGPLNTPEAAP